MRLVTLLAVLVLSACSSSPTGLVDDPELMSDEMPDAVRVAEGSFAGDNGYSVSGTAALYRRADGSHVVRLEDLDSSNGPDLELWLVRRTSGDVGEGGLALGDLKSTRGNQNYDVPADAALSDYRAVSVWCKRFSVSFGAAALAEV